MRVHDVAVIGGGVVGVTLARELSRYRLDVVLLERDAEVGFGVSKANSGIIHSGIHADPATVKGSLEWPGNVAWLRLRDDLGFGFAQVGELLVALHEDELPTLEAAAAQGRAARGSPGCSAGTRPASVARSRTSPARSSRRCGHRPPASSTPTRRCC
jgi:glycerol-3-phosphate dehydrogenase